MKTTNFIRQLQARRQVAAARAAATQAASVLESSAQAAAASKHRRQDAHQAPDYLQQQHQLNTKTYQAKARQQRHDFSAATISLEEASAGGVNEDLLKMLNNDTNPLVSGSSSSIGSATKASAKDKLDVSFNNTQLAYKSKSLTQLVRNWFVLGLCSSQFLVKNNKKIMKLTRSLLGKRAFELMMRATFYGQFVAGQDEHEIVPVIRHLSSFGVKTILDYSAEEDVDESEVCEEARKYLEKNQNELEYLAQAESGSPLRRYQAAADFADRRKYLPVARTYFYHGESQCERNLEIFFRAIDAVAQATGNTGFAAIKLTALGRPRLLMKLSKIIDYMRQLDGAGPSATGETIAQLLKRFESLHQGHINALDEDEEEMLFNLMRRVNRIAAYASQVGGARCMIDAEQTYMQPAINMIAMELMRQYNRREAIIFNTYQCYLKSAYGQVRQDLALARRENFFFGAKLVRGAYMDQERARAQKLGYEDPINESFEATSKMYEQTLAYLMGEIERELKLAGCLSRNSITSPNPNSNQNQNQNHTQNEPTTLTSGAGNTADLQQHQHQLMNLSNSRRISIMVASHNEDAIRFTLNEMERRHIEPGHRVICFGQLYGMCDHVSFMLGQAGYSMYKYTPYGPIEEVLPYLGRRAIENHGFLSKLERERNLLAKEIRTRLLTARWFYKPTGNYRPA